MGTITTVAASTSDETNANANEFAFSWRKRQQMHAKETTIVRLNTLPQPGVISVSRRDPAPAVYLRYATTALQKSEIPPGKTYCAAPTRVINVTASPQMNPLRCCQSPSPQRTSHPP